MNAVIKIFLSVGEAPTENYYKIQVGANTNLYKTFYKLLN